MKTCFAATSKDTREKVGLWEKVRKTSPILGFSDSAWGDNEGSCSTTGTLMLVGLGGVSWMSKCQPTVALSSTEAEYMAASAVVQGALFLRHLFEDLRSPMPGPITIYEGNSGCVKWAEGQGPHKRIRHLGLRKNFPREAVESALVKIEWLPTSLQLAGMLTKALDRSTFETLRTYLLGGPNVAPQENVQLHELTPSSNTN